MKHARLGCATVAIQNQTMVMGGVGNSVEIFDMQTQIWKSTPSMLYNRYDTCSVGASCVADIIDGKVIVVGGGDPAELYDPKTLK
mmetsp:Transcript_23990/g.55963  ORF Transcript_23990/g.55963 Transcript_23990/m.55963 type:complete len:85 (-) Transcript_23990:1215-1469(-)